MPQSPPTASSVSSSLRPSAALVASSERVSTSGQHIEVAYAVLVLSGAGVDVDDGASR
ncbi:hypothetical protein [Streptomyces uncialis]|nr:hypothetical protein [Streptomyces uncialis]MCX4658570.1 hypothetical protein [Streptomyces uncialis]